MSCPYLEPSDLPRGTSGSPRSLRAKAAAAGKRGPYLGTYYSEYLQLDKFLDCQKPLSGSDDHAPAHEELLFITVHQSHELWFKLIIADLARVHEILTGSVASIDPLSLPVEADLARAIASLERVKSIQPMLLQKLTVLETMTPMEFLEFRDFLVPASGFQSWQFRIVEILLGLSTNGRQNMSHEYMRTKLHPEHYERITEWENRPSLLDLTEAWLEHMPWLAGKQHLLDDSPLGDDRFDWMSRYKQAVYAALDSEEVTIRTVFGELGGLADLMETELDQVRINRTSFDSLFNPEQHEEMISRGVRKFSQKAVLNAIFAYLYRDLTALHSPYRFLNLLVEIDDGFTSWRYRHAQMAHRMIGRKMGTGATSGADHLLRVAQQNSSFKDLRNLSTFLISTSKLPPLPPTVLAVLAHH